VEKEGELGKKDLLGYTVENQTPTEVQEVNHQ
jgi:hypothetical protein